MKRPAGLIVGAVSGALITGACLYTLTLVWPGLLRRSPAATASGPVAATETAHPTDTPIPAETATPSSQPEATEESPFLREIGPQATPTTAPTEAPGQTGASALTISRLALQAPFEAQGFDFQPVQLADGRDRWVAASPDRLALVEIIGLEAVEAATISVFGPLDPNTDEAARRVVYMLTMMKAILPKWSDGAVWLSGEVVRAATQGGDFEAEITQQGVRVKFAVDAGAGASMLTFELP